MEDIPYYDTYDLRATIDAFLQKQTKLDAIIFIRRYYYSEPVKNIAITTGLKENKISKILLRLRKAFREDLMKGGINV